MTRKRWIVAPADKGAASEIASELGISPLTALLALNRGFSDSESIRNFLLTSDDGFCDPFAFPDMRKAVERIETAILNGEKILVFGDYDADGLTSTAVLKSHLEARGAHVEAYIPDRITEGYGLSLEAVEYIRQRDVSLIITVDNGISAVKEAELATEYGIDLVITDHHKVGDSIPKSVAVINPHLCDCTNECSLAGVGVAFKVICALEESYAGGVLEEYADLVAIGTVADAVPLVGENRALVKSGLNILNSHPRVGIKALMSVAGVLDKPINSQSVAFFLAPRINAAGRMGKAQRALDLLLTEDEEEASALALEIEGENAKRREVEEKIFSEALSIINTTQKYQHDRVIIVDGDNWHHGVIGIVASRLVDMFGKPCIVITKEQGNAKGSGRSLEGFSLYAALNAVSSLLTHFGGHELAAGFGLLSENINELRKAVNAYASKVEMPFPLQKIDVKLNPNAINVDIVDSIEELEPFGSGNNLPVFGLFGMTITHVESVSDGKHTKIRLKREKAFISVIFFKTSFESFAYSVGDKVDLAVQLSKNVFRNNLYVNIRAVNIKFSDINQDELLFGIGLYENYKRRESIEKKHYVLIYPERTEFAAVYRAVKDSGEVIRNPEKLCLAIGDDGSKIAAVLIVLDVLLEASIICVDETGAYCVVDNPPKTDLNKSAILADLRNCFE